MGKMPMPPPRINFPLAHAVTPALASGRVGWSVVCHRVHMRVGIRGEIAVKRLTNVTKKPKLFVSELERPAAAAKGGKVTTLAVGEETWWKGDVTTMAYGEEA